MENNLENEIRNLAYDMWRSAEYEFGHALDFWAMAEQMIVEMTADSARRATTAAATAMETATAWPSALRALYLYRVRELAHSMWTTSTEQRDRSMDYWLAAEKHLRLLTESAARTAGARLGKGDGLVDAFETFSPVNYLEQIRKVAYQLWESAGRQYGSALDFWLAAEQKVLDSLTANQPPTILEKAKQPEHPKHALKRRPPRRPATEK
ncbi:MAG: DUF2934 domain-containing protein [Candidatus Competibacteraceae bacterium]|nr:DUF2934 domain-containing protein [Candidatus Competibacteraceae bacterium]